MDAGRRRLPCAGRGEDLGIAISSLDSFAAEADDALRILDSQEQAVTGLVSSGAEVFGALSERQGQLSGLIRNTEAVFSTTARRNEDLKALFTVLPTFLRESRTTLTRLDQFAAESDPVITELRPAVRQLGPTLTSTANLASELQNFYPGLRAAINAAPKGFPALRRLLDDDLPPLLTRLPSFLDELTPIITVIRQYRHEVTGFLGNVAAATNAINDEGAGPLNYIRTMAPFSPEMLSAYPAPAGLEPDQSIHRAEGLPQAADRARVVRDGPVHGRDQRDPRPRLGLEPRLQLAHRRRRRRRPGSARPDAGVRVRRTRPSPTTSPGPAATSRRPSPRSAARSRNSAITCTFAPSTRRGGGARSAPGR